MSVIILHPVQVKQNLQRVRPQINSVVTRRAYEVYCHVFAEQPALMDLEGRACRGGFGILELVASLYAYPFPKSEWQDRVDEAMRGAQGL